MQAIVIVSLWSGFGYNLLLFGAALESIPQTYLDAAQIDGATAWQRFWRIKLPLISPTLFFGTVMTAITALQVFDQVYAMTRGGPGDRHRDARLLHLPERLRRPTGWATPPRSPG